MKPLKNKDVAMVPMSEAVPEGFFRISKGAAGVNFDVTPDYDQIEKDLDWCYARAKLLLKGMRLGAQV